MISQSPKFNDTADIKKELKEVIHVANKFLSSNENIYVHTLLISGILNRTYEFTDSAIWAINNERSQTTASLLRALIETLGITHYIWKNCQTSDATVLSEKMISFIFGSCPPLN
jgi:hypothetical protein